MLLETLREHHARRWFHKAENDLRNVEITMAAEDPPYDTICFHAQQAAEKYLKGFLTFHGIPFGRTHDLAELLDLGKPAADMEAVVGDLEELTIFAVLPRYPGDWPEPGKEEAQQARSLAYRVKEAVLDALRQKGFAP